MTGDPMNGVCTGVSQRGFFIWRIAERIVSGICALPTLCAGSSRIPILVHPAGCRNTEGTEGRHPHWCSYWEHERLHVVPVSPWIVWLLRLSCSQKPVGFSFGVRVFFTFEYLNNAGWVCAQFLRNECDRHTLKKHDVRSDCLDEIECRSLLCGDVQFDTRNWVSFVWGSFPKQVSHVGFSFRDVVGRTAQGISGIVPAILWSRALHECAGSSAGAMTANRRPSTQNIKCGSIVSQSILFDKRCGRLSKPLIFRGLDCRKYQIPIRNMKISSPRGRLLISLCLYGFRGAPCVQWYLSRVTQWTIVQHQMFSRSVGYADLVTSVRNAVGIEGRHPRFVADWGQARLHVAPVSSLMEPGRVGAACTARPFFQGWCHA